MNGFINVYKEKGFTSQDVCAKLRGILKTKKIGHTGTLDPAAVGVLPVCIGRATGFADEVGGKEKTYEAVLLLGTETDTYDLEGTVLSEKEVNCTEEELLSAVASFEGDIMQVPPMYSAKKVGGKKLYELARAGVTVERKAVPVTFYSIEVKEIKLPRVRLIIECSKGTYIRSLCHDIGEALGCGGCMESLIRTRVGQFSIENAFKLSEIEYLIVKGQAKRAVISVREMYKELAELSVKQEADKVLQNGNILKREAFSSPYKAHDRERVFVTTSEKKLVGLYVYDEKMHVFKPDKMLLED